VEEGERRKAISTNKTNREKNGEIAQIMCNLKKHPDTFNKR